MIFNNSCPICAASDWSTYYRGPIRVGRFGSLSSTDHTVWKCAGCGAATLEGAKIDYESDEYRRMVDGSGGSDTFYKTHDIEQAKKLSLLGSDQLRGRIVADFGAGAGSFLDLISGMTEKTIAIEPTNSFHPELRRKGHLVFNYGSEVSPELKGKVDLIVCFSVVEHVENPLTLFSEIRDLLAPGGRALISTPNRNDWLLSLLPNEYSSFFYRQVHRWYFDAASLSELANISGFSRSTPFFSHRFDFGNFVLWLRDRKPSGVGNIESPRGFDQSFAQALELSGKADYLYTWLYR